MIRPDDEFAALARSLAAHWRARGGNGDDPAEHLTVDAMARFRDGSLSAPERERAIAHVASCPSCRTELAELARATPRLPVLGRARRVALKMAPLAAAAVVVFALRPTLPGAPHREPGVMSEPVPRLHAPLGTVAETRMLSWSPVTGADRYRVTVFASDRVIFEIVQRDTTLALPDSLVIAPGSTYLWRVAARTGADRWVASELARFIVAGPRP